MIRFDDAHHDALLDAYADDMLDRTDRIAFERLLADEPALQRRLDATRAVDAALRRAWTPPPAEHFARLARETIAAGATAAPPAPIAGRFRIVSIAAAVLLLVGGAWLTWTALGPAGATPRLDPYGVQPARTMAAVYADEVESGFAPAVVCADGDEFEMWFRRQFAAPLRLAETPDDVRVLGLGYANVITPATIHLLAEVRGRPVVVFIDRLGDDDGHGNAQTSTRMTESGLHLHRGEAGALVLYELSPFGEPAVLAWLENPEGRN